MHTTIRVICYIDLSVFFEIFVAIVALPEFWACPSIGISILV